MPSRKSLREGRSSLELSPGSFAPSIADSSYGGRACPAGALSMMRSGSHAVKTELWESPRTWGGFVMCHTSLNVDPLPEPATLFCHQKSTCALRSCWSASSSAASLVQVAAIPASCWRLVGSLARSDSFRQRPAHKPVTSGPAPTWDSHIGVARHRA